VEKVFRRSFGTSGCHCAYWEENSITVAEGSLVVKTLKVVGCDKIRTEILEEKRNSLNNSCVKWPDDLGGNRRFGKLKWSSPYAKCNTEWNALTTRHFAHSASSKKGDEKQVNMIWRKRSAVFILVSTSQTKFPLSNEFSRNLGNMPRCGPYKTTA